MAIDKQGLKEMAYLARLELSNAELAQCQEQLSAVLDYVAIVQEAQLDNLKSLGLSSDFYNRKREDLAQAWDQEEIKIALDQAKEIEDGQVKVRRVLKFKKQK